MTETSLDDVIPEQEFLRLLGGYVTVFGRLTVTLLGQSEPWPKRYYFQLNSESDEVESFLDDFGARYNDTIHHLTELTASIRGLSIAGLSLEHLCRRLEGYGVLGRLDPADAQEVLADIERARGFTQEALMRLVRAWREECDLLGVDLPADGLPQEEFQSTLVRLRLPRSYGQEEIADEQKRIAEIASKYLQACEMLAGAGFHREDDAAERGLQLSHHCREEHARVYEATVHNLQSAYDTYIKNTVLEGQDERLSILRGHVSASLHLLEAVTQFTHFVERHESEMRADASEERLGALVPRHEISDVVLNVLLHWAGRFLEGGSAYAEELVPTYSNLQALELELSDGVYLHARPAALIVNVVNHHGTPVEMEVAGETCNAGSILELMVLVGSNPEARSYAFRGDERPLADIALLFEHAFGENGWGDMPTELAYLRP